MRLFRSTRLRKLRQTALVSFGIGLMAVTVSAGAGLAVAQTVTQSYVAGPGVRQGMIVELDSKNSGQVDPLTQEDIASMQGVVVAAGDSAVTLSNNDANQVYVATTGSYDVLVSTQNGSIKKGSYVSVSSLAGVGMKAGSDQQLVVGKALEAFDGSNNVVGTTSLATDNGGDTKVSLGLIQVDIGIARNPLASSSRANAPGFLSNAAESIADKPVSTLRLYVGLAILLITVIVVGTMLYAAVRSSLVSIGRNPLAKKSITRGLLKVALIGLIVFVIGLFAVYLILKL